MEMIDHTTSNPVANVLSGYYKNADVGAHGISALLPEVEDMKLRRELFEQRSWYESQKRGLRAQMAEVFLEPAESSRLARCLTDVMIRCRSKTGMTTADAARLMVEGTNRGMVQLHQVLNHNPNIPDDLRAQGEQILAREKRYLDRLTPYL